MPMMATSQEGTLHADAARAEAETLDALAAQAASLGRALGRKPRVLVGMSGGVDSSVAAALLVEAGFDVCGAYMKNWILDVPGMRCPWADDLADAKRTAVRLGIDFDVCDFQEAYKREVVDYLVEEYRFGRTPNPDVMCNQEVKFGLFLDAALAKGFDLIATGHYARTGGACALGAQRDEAAVRFGNCRLLRAADAAKDQTYFLYRMSQRAVDHTLFPLGSLTKPQVRSLAEKRGLPSAAKADSQGICFVGEAGIREFLSMYVERKPGPTIDVATGETIGHHDGAIFFTMGQRKGLGIGGGTVPYYVVGKDMDLNAVYVSGNPETCQLQADELVLSRLNWISGAAPAEGDYLVRTRHTGPLLSAHVEAADDTARVVFPDAQRAVAAGQSVVIYDGEACLGGGMVR